LLHHEHLLDLVDLLLLLPLEGMGVPVLLLEGRMETVTAGGGLLLHGTHDGGRIGRTLLHGVDRNRIEGPPGMGKHLILVQSVCIINQPIHKLSPL
jgi:hypothetical protein